jgi:hypothetical protein
VRAIAAGGNSAVTSSSDERSTSDRATSGRAPKPSLPWPPRVTVARAPRTRGTSGSPVTVRRAGRAGPLCRKTGKAGSGRARCFALGCLVRVKARSARGTARLSPVPGGCAPTLRGRTREGGRYGSGERSVTGPALETPLRSGSASITSRGRPTGTSGGGGGASGAGFDVTAGGGGGGAGSTVAGGGAGGGDVTVGVVVAGAVVDGPSRMVTVVVTCFPPADPASACAEPSPAAMTVMPTIPAVRRARTGACTEALIPRPSAGPPRAAALAAWAYSRLPKKISAK